MKPVMGFVFAKFEYLGPDPGSSPRWQC